MHCTRCRKPFSAFTNFTNCWRKFEMATWVRLFKADGCPTQEQWWIYMACSDQAQQHPKKHHRNPWFQQWSYIISVFLLFFKGDVIVNNISFLHCFFTDFFAAAKVCPRCHITSCQLHAGGFQRFLLFLHRKARCNDHDRQIEPARGAKKKLPRPSKLQRFIEIQRAKQKQKKSRKLKLTMSEKTPPWNDSNSNSMEV